MEFLKKTLEWYGTLNRRGKAFAVMALAVLVFIVLELIK
tara:strand:- start:1183 stop:1299 length:117 start_codon:yes stop_codon:yes gene_type:complete